MSFCGSLATWLIYSGLKLTKVAFLLLTSERSGQGQTRRGYEDSREKEVELPKGGGICVTLSSLRVHEDAEPAGKEQLAADQGLWDGHDI